MNEERADERRKVGRKRVMLAGTLARLDQRVAVRLLDLSPNGATVAGNDLPQRNARVELRREGRKMRGRIRWRSNERAGVHFDETHDVLDLLRPIASPRPSYIEPCRRPTLKPQRMSNAEQADFERCAALLGTAMSK